jgi:hypothetical protein
MKLIPKSSNEQEEVVKKKKKNNRVSFKDVLHDSGLLMGHKF